MLGKAGADRAVADAGRVGGQERGTGVKGAQGEQGGSSDEMQKPEVRESHLCSV